MLYHQMLIAFFTRLQYLLTRQFTTSADDYHSAVTYWASNQRRISSILIEETRTKISYFFKCTLKKINKKNKDGFYSNQC